MSEDGSVDRVEMVDEVSAATDEGQQPDDGGHGDGGSGQSAGEASDTTGRGSAATTEGSPSGKSPLMQTGDAIVAGVLAALAASAAAFGATRKMRGGKQA